ncbi:MAG: bifunctional hydroxymethylpyrimidine kinase/phosphomethylpyrimidine kinase [Candidatus Zipacnadales bacterium]
MPTVLTIAGSDPTGGAGIQADLQTFASLGAHGAAVITAITIQDTREVHECHHLPPHLVREQLTCLLDDVAVSAIKTGMLVNATIVTVVAEVLREHPLSRLIVDPVIASTSGTRLLDDEGIEALRELLLPHATLVTPNVIEAARLTGCYASTEAEMASCAEALCRLGPRAVLVTGGHLAGDPVDVLQADGQTVTIRGERVRLPREVHGTGCVLSAATATLIAQGSPIYEAVVSAKRYVSAGLRSAWQPGTGSYLIDYAAAAKAAL